MDVNPLIGRRFHFEQVQSEVHELAREFVQNLRQADEGKEVVVYRGRPDYYSMVAFGDGYRDEAIPLPVLSRALGLPDGTDSLVDLVDGWFEVVIRSRYGDWDRLPASWTPSAPTEEGWIQVVNVDLDPAYPEGPEGLWPLRDWTYTVQFPDGNLYFGCAVAHGDASAETLADLALQAAKFAWEAQKAGVYRKPPGQMTGEILHKMVGKSIHHPPA